MSDPVLYGYWRSSAAYRVRIAVNVKGVAAQYEYVRLREGEQRRKPFLALNPAGLVPAWRDADGFVLGQSLAIIEYIDDVFPEPPLLPSDPRLKAICREIAYGIACDIHPLGNLRVLERLSADFGASAEARAAWCRQWIGRGFAAIEPRLVHFAGRHSIGDQISLADICLVPQVYNARRFGLDLTPFPRIVAADASAREQPAFAAAAPETQPDAPSASPP
ncbi:maleylacetoacetate isomerase [Methylocapsa acidiphila]|uniref:maleylacetoacetate isomerase n=1 Tax=Methylocapsa acidiphila TaxID=133552 RepID=UPI00047D6329|nr:maleylacetoacetate isomerase [Methylocapsa acidiphila]